MLYLNKESWKTESTAYVKVILDYYLERLVLNTLLKTFFV